MTLSQICPLITVGAPALSRSMHDHRHSLPVKIPRLSLVLLIHFAHYKTFTDINLVTVGYPDYDVGGIYVITKND